MSVDEKKVHNEKVEEQSQVSSEVEEFDPNLHDPREASLHRGLKARQISMIALGGAVGTGLIIGSGTALRRGGPLGLLLGYAYVGFVCYLVMVSLGEMAAYLPHKKGFAGYATRFVDPALGFALGWNYLLKYLIVTPNNINAAGVVVQYWPNGREVHIAIWMVIFIAAIFVVNFLGVRVFGELEFWLSSAKILALIGMLLFGIIIDLGGNPQKDRIGFRYWKAPNGPMGKYLLDQVKNTSLSIFLGFWATLTNALFAYMGTELIGVTVGEAQNPRRNIPIAIRRTFFRILVFYVGGVFVIGLIVPSTDESLFIATQSKTGAAASPFVVAAGLVGISALRHVINGAILIFVMSAANSDLYIGSRTLYGLAIEGKAPAVFKIVNKMGVPWPSLLFCTAWCGLVFLNVASTGSKVFGWFVNLVSTFGALTWLCILYSHMQFMKALKAQGISRDTLPYKAPFQPWGNWFAFVSTLVITFFKGFDTFIPFNTANFITSYIAIPVFFMMWFGYKYLMKTKVVRPADIDLVTGLRAIDEEEQRYLAEQAAKGPRTRWQRIWDAL
ncbi:dicarboxylic amino acid permease [Coprinopsis cinerea okayama7|uniref:Dicarboxylic amino acid permease n=1 Tax=Coprinopsis cinerea (strain Okayama-7 / 130 / ATCC MYA-4618 / FGSC 9003) TaxID=240176 RepID=A8NFK5_COPC7|nr:dicarboxylic amino acid permease [Coprinopsis cinerea okayama7\|eukprot:XP_001833309.2 dicarboxylic amino acid permease [Coprinopsis cinerea okayama7\